MCSANSKNLDATSASSRKSWKKWSTQVVKIFKNLISKISLTLFIDKISSASPDGATENWSIKGVIRLLIRSRRSKGVVKVRYVKRNMWRNSVSIVEGSTWLSPKSFPINLSKVPAFMSWTPCRDPFPGPQMRSLSYLLIWKGGFAGAWKEKERKNKKKLTSLFENLSKAVVGDSGALEKRSLLRLSNQGERSDKREKLPALWIQLVEIWRKKFPWAQSQEIA